jgi:hypothetical protein
MRLNQKLPWWVSAIGIILVLGIIPFHLFMSWNASQPRMTYYALNAFEKCVNDYAFEVETIPGPTLQDAMILILKKSQTNENLKKTLDSIGDTSFSFLMRNQDGWKRSFVYEQKDDGFLITLRSVGENGRDEEGKGDDLQRRIDLRWMKPDNEEKK